MYICVYVCELYVNILKTRQQGHVDMVTEKNSDVVHDWFQDPLRLVRDGDDWLKVRKP